jgi:hypothetical protein
VLARDGRWLYYTRMVNTRWRVEKVSVEGSDPVIVRGEGFVHAPTAGDGAIFFAMRSEHVATIDWTVCRASPEDGPADEIGRIRAARLPLASTFVHCTLSPDGQWLALPLIDGATTNIWALPSSGGPMRQLTDFDGRPTLIARQVCWSPDGQYLYAAVADVGADVVMYGLI